MSVCVHNLLRSVLTDKNEDEIKNKDDLKNEDNLKNENNLKHLWPSMGKNRQKIVVYQKCPQFFHNCNFFHVCLS